MQRRTGLPADDDAAFVELYQRHVYTLLSFGQGTGGERRYSEDDVARLRRIRRLQHDLGINLAGVEVILHLLKRLEALRQELEQERTSHEP